MSDTDLKFIIFGDVIVGYWWSLRSAKGETVKVSEWRHRQKGECEREVHSLRERCYPSAQVRDATIG